VTQEYLYAKVHIPGKNRQGVVNTTMSYLRKIGAFDEPAIGIGWPAVIAPHRVGIVGESLFVHSQVSDVSVCFGESVGRPTEAVNRL
jgi:hypothetical protein